MTFQLMHPHHLRKAIVLLAMAALLPLGCASTGGSMKEAASPVHPKSSGAYYQPNALPGYKYKWTPDEHWVDSTLSSLTLRQKVGQMIVAYSMTPYMSYNDPDFLKLAHMVQKQQIGGIAVSLGNIYEQVMMLNRLQKLAGVPLLIASDYENGLGMRLRGGISFPSNMALGATRDSSLVYKIGRVVGEEARAVGVEQVYAPVSDVNDNPENPIINVRSYGENPQLVASMASEFVKGVQSEGAIATAKHFPGHGDTHVDSHLGLPVVDYGMHRLDTLELVPFRADIAAGVRSVMVAHIAFPRIDSEPGVPGTLSPAITTGLLKDSLNFHGLVVTDALTMGGVVKGFTDGAAAIRAVNAGADILLMPPDNHLAIESIVAAVKEGKISQSRVDNAVRKILEVKSELGLDRARLINVNDIDRVVGTESHELLAEHAARRSITIVRNDSNVLPLQYRQPGNILCLVVTDNGNPFEADYFKRELLKRYDNVSFAQINPTSNEVDFKDAMNAVDTSSLVLIPAYIQWRSGTGTIDFTPQVQAFLDTVTNSGKPVVMVSFGNPYLLRSVPGVTAYVCAYGAMKVSVQAAVQALFGEINVSGKLPVTIPGVAKYGRGIDMRQTSLRFAMPQEAGFTARGLARLDSTVNYWIADSAFPGAQLLVVKDGLVVLDKAFGTYNYSPTSQAVNLNTMFGLASLTKVTATTQAAMKLYGEGKLDLNAPVVKYLPQFGQNGKEKVTIRNLMVHDSGLPPDPPRHLWWDGNIPKKQLERLLKHPWDFVIPDSFGTNFDSAHQAMWDSLYATPLAYKTGTKMVYSDINFLILGKVIEKITGMPLAEYVEKNFYKPLGMTNTMFTPPLSRKDQCVTEEYDSVAGQYIQGYVHDENSRSLGGAVGHAGLFSTASDLGELIQMMQNGGVYDGRRYLKDSVIALFTRKQSDLSTRALGWDTKSPRYSSAGTLFSPNSWGHLGYTGTSIWVDPARNLFAILLTNRVCPTRKDHKIWRVRPIVYNQVIEALENRK